jgi:hypothetical protein
MAATGAVGLDCMCSFGVSVTVTVLWTTCVTVTYETEHGATWLFAPVFTGIKVTVSVVVDCKVMVVVASPLAAATLFALFGPWGGPWGRPVGDGRVIVA